jgi:hypothetical protein
LKEAGLIIPQQTIDCEEMMSLLSKVTLCLKDNFYTGYFTVLIYSWLDPVSVSFKIEFAQIDAVHFINRNQKPTKYHQL